MKKFLSVLVLLVFAGFMIGCGPKPEPPVEPEITPGTENISNRAEPTETEDVGLKTEESTVEELPAIDLVVIHFDTDKATIRDDARDILKRNAELLSEYPEVKVIIEGHCDERNTVEYNLALGERRAAATKEYLIRLGIDGSRLSTISYGEERPVSFGHDEASWQANRRAAFVLTH